MNNFPEELMKPPDGYEWTGEMGRADELPNSYFAAYVASEGWVVWHGSNLIEDIRGHGKFPILRKAKPPTVMVELPRAVCEAIAGSRVPQTFGAILEVACRAALEREANE